MYPMPQAFVSTGYKSLVRKGVERKAAAFFPGAWATLKEHLLALGADAVLLKGPCQVQAEGMLQRWGLQLFRESLNAFPDLVAGLVQAVLGSVAVDPDVPRERSQWERTFRCHYRS